MKYSLNIKQDDALDFLSLGALNHRVDSGIVPLMIEWSGRSTHSFGYGVETF
jgi:hypothetical protein